MTTFDPYHRNRGDDLSTPWDDIPLGAPSGAATIVGTGVAPYNAGDPTLTNLLEQGALTDNATHELDPTHRGDKRVALAKATVETEHERLVIDLAKVAGHMGEKFAIAPIRFCGKRLGRIRDTRDGECCYFVGSDPLIRRIWWVTHNSRWVMQFEPGIVGGYTGGGGVWRLAYATIPPVPAEYRPETDKNMFILWEQNWRERILLPRDPALVERIVGDVFVVHHTWDLTPLEAAALRGKR